MDRGAAITLTALTGGLIALQAPINSNLGKSIGTFQAALVSFLLGTVVLLVLAALGKGGMGAIGAARHVPWWYLLGGILGAAYVSTVLVSVRTLGAGGVTAATIAGQLATAVVVDHFGLLGVDRNPVSVSRLAGVALLAGGTYLVVRA
jgi:transporter family-2 protein